MNFDSKLLAQSQHLNNKVVRVQKFYEDVMQEINSRSRSQNERDVLAMQLNKYISNKASSTNEIAMIMDRVVAKKQEKKANE